MENNIVEFFHSIQGEGRSIGRNALFIRLQGCNLKCAFCDSQFANCELQPKLFNISEVEIPARCKLVVITGGEPLVRMHDLLSIKHALLRPGLEFEIETNGTLFPEYVGEFNWNISPKLSSSSQQSNFSESIRLQSIEKWANYARERRNNHVVFKFVISKPMDFYEVDYLIGDNNIPRDLVYLMPEGTTKEKMNDPFTHKIIEHALEKGYNYSPRIHVMIWGSKRGV